MSDEVKTVERKTTFYWASIAGAEPEPVEVTMLDGRKVAYTLGCPDPFYLDEKPCPVKLGSKQREWGGMSDFFDNRTKTPMLRPPLPTKYQKQRDKERREWENRPTGHRWRGDR